MTAQTRQFAEKVVVCVFAVIAVALACAAISQLSGCAVGRTQDGADLIGVRLDDAAVTAAGNLGGVVGGLFGGPVGAQVGTGLATGIAGLFFGLRRGERKGWDEAVGTPGKPAEGGRTVPTNGGAS